MFLKCAGQPQKELCALGGSWGVWCTPKPRRRTGGLFSHSNLYLSPPRLSPPSQVLRRNPSVLSPESYSSTAESPEEVSDDAAGFRCPSLILENERKVKVSWPVFFFLSDKSGG